MPLSITFLHHLDLPPANGTNPETGVEEDRLRPMMSRSARSLSNCKTDPFVGALTFFRVYSGT